MKREFIWLASDKGRLFSAPFSGEIVLPASAGPDTIKQTTGANVWVVHEKRPPYLTARIFVDRIEEYTDGPRKGDFVLIGNRAKSLWIADGTEDSTAWVLPSGVIADEQLRELAESQATNLCVWVEKRTAKLFSSHPPGLLHSIPSPPDANRLTPRKYVEQQYDLVIRNIPLSHAAKRTGERWSPFASVTFAKICTDRPDLDKNKIDRWVDERERETHRSKKNRVDIELRKIIPAEIYARSFVAAASQTDGIAAAQKTAQAEKTHQNMLKDIAEWIKQQGVTPCDTRSVDLVFDCNGSIVVIEIKSATDENILHQGRTGIVQIAEYGLAFKEAGKILAAEMLIIQSAGHWKNLRHLARLGRRFGVTVLFYDSRKNWPRRVARIEKIKKIIMAERT